MCPPTIYFLGFSKSCRFGKVMGWRKRLLYKLCLLRIHARIMYLRRFDLPQALSTFRPLFDSGLTFFTSMVGSARPRAIFKALLSLAGLERWWIVGKDYFTGYACLEFTRESCIYVGLTFRRLFLPFDIFLILAWPFFHIDGRECSPTGYFLGMSRSCRFGKVMDYGVKITEQAQHA